MESYIVKSPRKSRKAKKVNSKGKVDRISPKNLHIFYIFTRSAFGNWVFGFARKFRLSEEKCVQLIECLWTDWVRSCSPSGCEPCWRRSRSAGSHLPHPLRWLRRRGLVQGKARDMNVRWVWRLALVMDTSKQESGSVSSHELRPIQMSASTKLGCRLVSLKKRGMTLMDSWSNKLFQPVSTHCIGCPVSVFQKRMHRSAVPPPLTSKPWWWGDQAIALTAAMCSEYDWTGLSECWFHT